jgi:hypothetical protein
MGTKVYVLYTYIHIYIHYICIHIFEEMLRFILQVYSFALWCAYGVPE